MTNLYFWFTQSGNEDKNEITGKKTLETLKSGERLLEAIELATTEIQLQKQYEDEVETISKMKEEQNSTRIKLPDVELPSKPQPNVLMMGLTPSKFVLKALMSISSADLEQSLMLLPFDAATRLMGFFDDWLKEVKKKKIDISFFF